VRILHCIRDQIANEPTLTTTALSEQIEEE
jgi:hypothetical protein